MRFANFLSELLDSAKRDSDGNIILPSGVVESASTRLNVEELALFSVIDLIASAGSLCEWRTYQHDQRTKGNDWYAWNISPNQNQNATEFKRILIARLLRFNEALVFFRNGNYYIADGFSREQYAFRPNRYSSITCCNLSLNYSLQEDDVFYFRLANQHAATLLGNLRGLYSKALDEAWSKYQHSGGRSGIVQISSQARSRPTFESDMEKLMNERFRTFFEKKMQYFPCLKASTIFPRMALLPRKAPQRCLTWRVFSGRLRIVRAMRTISPQVFCGVTSPTRMMPSTVCSPSPSSPPWPSFRQK